MSGSSGDLDVGGGEVGGGSGGVTEFYAPWCGEWYCVKGW